MDRLLLLWLVICPELPPRVRTSTRPEVPHAGVLPSVVASKVIVSNADVIIS